MSEVKVNKISPRSGTTITLGDSGDTFTVPSGVTFDASSGGLAGTLTTAAQPNITSVGTLTSFASTGIDDNATSTAITIDSSERVGIGITSPTSPLMVQSNETYSIHAKGANAKAILVETTDGETGISLIKLKNSAHEYNIENGRRANTLTFYGNPGGERMCIDSSGNVGIGTSSPSSYYSTELVISTSDTGGITLANSNTTHASYIMFADGTTGSQPYVGQFGYDHNVDAMVFHTNVSERMRINSSGNVGIGTSSPTQKLDVNGTVKATGFEGDGSALTGISAGVAGISSSADATSITIDSSERVGILRTSPVGTLDVNGNGMFDATSSFYGNKLVVGAPNPNQTSSGGYGWGMHSSGAMYWTMEDANSYWNNTNVNNSHLINFRTKGNSVGNINIQQSSTTFGTSSDYRLKENVNYDFDATSRLKQLKPARFNWIIDETNTLVDGFLAHEVSDIVPEAIVGEKDAVDEDGNIEPQSIDQSKLVPLLVKTIQELEARITTLENA
jgi:hypothetical protein